MYRAVVENARVVICVIDESGRCRFMNPFAARELGGRAEDFVGKTVWDLFPKEAADAYLGSVLQAIRTGSTVERETPTIVAGRARCYRGRAFPLRQPGARTDAALVIATDITQAKQAEEALRAAKNRLEHIINNSSDVIFEIDLEGNYTFGSPSAERMTGYPLAELLKMNMRQLVAPEFHDIVFDRLRRRMAGEAPQQPFSFEIIHRDGHRVPVELTTNPCYRDGKLVAIQGISRDITERMRAERDLLVLDHAIRASASGVALADLDGRLTYVNPAMLRLWGYQDEREMLGRDAREFWQEPARAEAVLEALRGRGTWVGELAGRRKDGSALDVELGASMVTDDAGRALCMMGSFLDITARRQVEDALRRSREQFLRVFEDGPVGMAMVGRGRVILRANRALCRMLEYGEGELDGVNIWDVTDPEDRGIETDWAARVARGQSPSFRIEKRYLAKSGRVVWAALTSTVVRDPSDGSTYALSAVEDITERKRMEQALREGEAKYRTIVEDQTDLICRFGPDLTVTFVNEAYCRYFGTRREELLGRSFVPKIRQEDRALVRASIAALSRDHPTRTHEQQVVLPDGRVRWQQWTNRAIFDGEGNVVEYQGTGQDITERKQGEEALRTLHHRLMTARESERRTLAQELHDSVGQGLVAVQLRLRGLLDTTDAPAPAVSQALSALSDQCDALLHEVRHICRGLYPAALESLGLVAALRQLARDMPPAGKVVVRASGQVRDRRFQPDVESALFRIAQEAITNAVRHGKPERILVAISGGGDVLRVKVTDDGKGFDAASASVGGLGLTTMRERAQAVGGTLRIDSRPGRTSVVATVPLASWPPGRPKESPAGG